MALPTQIKIGTTAGPITSPDEHKALMGNMLGFTQQKMQQPQFRGNSPAAQQLNQNYAGNLQNNNNRNMLQFDRAASLANAQENLRSQQARAGIGNQYLQQAEQGRNRAFANQAQTNSMLLGLLSSNPNFFGIG